MQFTSTCSSRVLRLYYIRRRVHALHVYIYLRTLRNQAVTGHPSHGAPLLSETAKFLPTDSKGTALKAVSVSIGRQIFWH